jgi:hypothetical protein
MKRKFSRILTLIASGSLAVMAITSEHNIKLPASVATPLAIAAVLAQLATNEKAHKSTPYGDTIVGGRNNEVIVPKEEANK